MAWLAIDAGTSVIKAVVFNDDGREIALARRRTAAVRPQTGWSEQNMEEVWSATVDVALEATSTSGTAVGGIVITAQGDGCWLVDEDCRPTGNAILWNDARAAQPVAAWQEAGVLDAAFRISGSATYPGLMNAILPWLEQHAPERVERARWALSCNGWLFAKLTGTPAADLSDASNPFSDVSAGTYSHELVALFGAHRYASLLPPIARGTGATGALTEAAAAQLRLPTGLPVVMAPYDIVCTAYGAGATLPGDACVILGTALCAELFTDTLDFSGAPVGTTVAVANKLFLRAMPTLTGCEAFDWAANMLGLDGVPALDALAAQCGPPSDVGRVMFLPYLSPAGERSPFLAAQARGSFHGLSLQTTHAEMARAVFEGLAFVILECFLALTKNAASGTVPDKVRVCGGGAASDLWCRVIADVLGIPIARSREAENGARGAHLFALASTGVISSIHEGVARFVPEPQIFSPNPQAYAIYRSRFKLFQGMRDALRPLWPTGAQ